MHTHTFLRRHWNDGHFPGQNSLVPSFCFWWSSHLFFAGVLLRFCLLESPVLVVHHHFLWFPYKYFQLITIINIYVQYIINIYICIYAYIYTQYRFTHIYLYIHVHMFVYIYTYYTHINRQIDRRIDRLITRGYAIWHSRGTPGATSPSRALVPKVVGAMWRSTHRAKVRVAPCGSMEVITMTVRCLDLYQKGWYQEVDRLGWWLLGYPHRLEHPILRVTSRWNMVISLWKMVISQWNMVT